MTDLRTEAVTFACPTEDAAKYWATRMDGCTRFSNETFSIEAPPGCHLAAMPLRRNGRWCVVVDVVNG